MLIEELPDQKVVISRDLILDIFCLTTGCEDKFWERNEHGFCLLEHFCFEWK